VIGVPPFDGAVNATVADVDPVAVAAPITGASGDVNVLTDPDAPDATDVRPEFDALTVNVYVVPAVSPVTVMVPEPACDRVPLPPAGLDVAVYLVIGEPPSDGAVNATFAVVDPVAVAAPITGAFGALNP